MESESKFRDHQEGFEKERRFHIVLGQALAECPTLKARTLERIIAHFDPDFMANLFEERPCVRSLKYIGLYEDEYYTEETSPDFFEKGKIYKSITFTGATYTIEGYHDGKKNIGCAHFKWLD